MKLPEQHKAEQLFQLGYVVVTEFASSHSPPRIAIKYIINIQ